MCHLFSIWTQMHPMFYCINRTHLVLYNSHGQSHLSRVVTWPYMDCTQPVFPGNLKWHIIFFVLLISEIDLNPCLINELM